MNEAAITWVQPAAIIAGVVAILGWFVAYGLRFYEARQENRRAIYTKVLHPAAGCIAALRHAHGGNRRIWARSHGPSFNEALVKLIADAGEVALIRKQKVTWAANNLAETLERARELGSIDDGAYKDTIGKIHNDSLRARAAFLLTAGRSLESLPIRLWRDQIQTVRYHHLRDIKLHTREGSNCWGCARWQTPKAMPAKPLNGGQPASEVPLARD